MDGCCGAGLKEGVTDSGLSMLASAGCGAQLTSLALACEGICVMLVLGRSGVMD